MIRFACDTCLRLKEPKEVWILGLAAERMGVTSAIREISILPDWDASRAVDPLAVHFCSVDCKGRYVDELFGDHSGKEMTTSTRTGESRRRRKPQTSHARRRKNAA